MNPENAAPHASNSFFNELKINDLVKKFAFLTCLFCLLATALFSQKRTEADMKKEEVFIAAHSFFLLQKFDKAAAAYEKLLLDQPKNDAAWYELARSWQALKEPTKALDAVRRAVELNPQNEWYQLFEGENLEAQGRTKEAAKVFEALVKRFPDRPVFYEKWGYLLLLNEDPNGALKAFDRLEKLTGVTTTTARKKHTILAIQGNNKRATEELEKLVRAFPDEPEFAHELGLFLEKTGERQRAQLVYQQILAKNPDDAVANLALVELTGGDELAKINAFKPLFADGNQPIDPKIGALLEWLPAVQAGKNPSLVAAVLDLAATLETAHADDAKAFSISGDLLFQANQPREAAIRYEKCLALRSTVFPVWDNLMTIRRDLFEWETLLKTADRAADFFPNQARVWLFRGIALTELGRFDEAAADLGQATIMAGNNLPLKADAWDNLGLVFYKKKDWATARQKFETGLQKCGEANPFLLEHLGDALFQLGEVENALGFWKRAAEKGLKSPRLEQKISEKRL